jgi:hypothetical protein
MPCPYGRNPPRRVNIVRPSKHKRGWLKQKGGIETRPYKSGFGACAGMTDGRMPSAPTHTTGTVVLHLTSGTVDDRGIRVTGPAAIPTIPDDEKDMDG